MKHPYTRLALGAAVLAFGVIYLAQGIVANTQQRIAIEAQRRVDNTTITIGRLLECSVEVRLSIWESMNELSVYRWVAMCEAGYE